MIVISSLQAVSMEFDSRIASTSYSNLAAVLAGIVLAVLTIVIQASTSDSREHTNPSLAGLTLREVSSLNLLVALFGFIVSSLNYAVQSGWTEQTRTLQLVPLLVGSGFSLSCLMLFCAMVTLCRLYLTPTAARWSFAIVSIAGIGAYTFLSVNVIDYLTFGSDQAINPLYAFLAWFGAGVFYAIFPFSRCIGLISLSANRRAYIIMWGTATGLITLLTIASLVLPMWSHGLSLHPTILWSVVLLLSLFFGFVLSMTPHSISLSNSKTLNA